MAKKIKDIVLDEFVEKNDYQKFGLSSGDLEDEELQAAINEEKRLRHLNPNGDYQKYDLVLGFDEEIGQWIEGRIIDIQTTFDSDIYSIDPTNRHLSIFQTLFIKDINDIIMNPMSEELFEQ